MKTGILDEKGDKKLINLNIWVQDLIVYSLIFNRSYGYERERERDSLG